MITYTRHTQQKLEKIFNELDYKILYEKGNFLSGYCMVEENNFILINKFFDVEGRINCLLEILSEINYDPRMLTDKSKQYVYMLIKSKIVVSPLIKM